MVGKGKKESKQKAKPESVKKSDVAQKKTEHAATKPEPAPKKIQTKLKAKAVVVVSDDNVPAQNQQAGQIGTREEFFETFIFGNTDNEKMPGVRTEIKAQLEQIDKKKANQKCREKVKVQPKQTGTTPTKTPKVTQNLPKQEAKLSKDDSNEE